MSNSTYVTPIGHITSATLSAADSGDNEVVAAVAGKEIVVHQLLMISSGTVNIRFESGAGGTELVGLMELTAQVGFVLPFSPVGWFRTAAGVLLNLELSAAVSVGGTLAYSEQG